MSTVDRELRNSIEFLPNRLYYVPLTIPPSAVYQNKHFFSIDNDLVYWNFYLDFGPLNLGQLYRFCSILNRKLSDPKLKDKVIYYYSSSHPHKRANAAYLISSWALLYLNKSPEDSFQPFRAIANTFPTWHDATPTVCPFQLTILDTLRGLYKARECGFFDFRNFDIEEYEHFEQVENGDLNWYVSGKFVAFAGPHSRESAPRGFNTLTPEFYVPYFKRKNVTLVVRLNKKYYDAKSFTSQGIDHMDLYFEDGSNPPESILSKFIARCEETPGAVAVHCKAGLGRTGTCIAAYIMKHYKFTAEEIIGWMRIVRPGSVIGPQQQFLRDIQQRMWRDGDLQRSRIARPLSTTPPRKFSDESKVVSTIAKSLVDEITGPMGSMQIRTNGHNNSTNNNANHSNSESIKSSVGSSEYPSDDKSRHFHGNSEKEAQGDSLRLRRQQQAMQQQQQHSNTSGNSGIGASQQPQLQQSGANVIKSVSYNSSTTYISRSNAMNSPNNNNNNNNNNNSISNSNASSSSSSGGPGSPSSNKTGFSLLGSWR